MNPPLPGCERERAPGRGGGRKEKDEVYKSSPL